MVLVSRIDCKVDQVPVIHCAGPGPETPLQGIKLGMIPSIVPPAGYAPRYCVDDIIHNANGYGILAQWTVGQNCFP